MKQKYSKQDFIPGTNSDSKKNIPLNFEYWNPSWEFKDGKVIKNEKVEVYECNHCEFVSKTETGIKIHVSSKHKN